MDELYIFSHNNLYIKSNGDLIPVNSISTALIQNYNEENLNIIEKNINQMSFTNLTLADTLEQNLPNNIRASKIDGNLYCEIIHTNNSIHLQKFCTKSCEIVVYNNYVEVLCNNNFFEYYFYGEQDNNAIEYDGTIYIFNQHNILEFNTKNNVFCLKKCKKYAKNGQNIEILCQTPKNNVYFLLYKFDIKNSIVSKKPYKNDNILSYDNFTLPITFFHLAKSNINDAKNLLDSNLKFDDIKKYLCQFDDIWEIDSEYFLSSSKQICKIKVKIQNNLIVDID